MVMDGVEVRRSGARHPGPSGSGAGGWWGAALAGATAFWMANLAISLTPIAADFRAAASIAYAPMLVEAAVGGIVVAGAVAFVLARFADHLPGHGPLGQALVLTAAALVLLTVAVAVPARLRSDVADPGHWLLVETLIDAIRFLALGVAVGLVTRARAARPDRHRGVARKARP
jgi:hypothetical protein